MLVFVMCVKLIFLGSKIISSFYQMHFFSLSVGTFFYSNNYHVSLWKESEKIKAFSA
jgi:hypothetical protein